MTAVDHATAPGSTSQARSSAASPTTHRVTVVSFTVASLLGSSLLFLVQPMVGRLLLPLAGGTPSLWNTAMVFFQGVLLAGYLYSHLTIGKLGIGRHLVAQSALVLVPLAVLPIAVPGGWRLPAEASPALWTLLVLTVMVGLPFFVLSTASTTFQRWFSVTDHPHAADPYFLYAAGNVGSLASLVAYPLLIEPRLTLAQQARLWTGLYVAFAAATIGCAGLVRRRANLVGTGSGGSGDAAAVSAEAVTSRRRARWVFVAFVPSALMLGVTRHMATDVASMPLLWIVPLTLYLVTFVVAFGRGTGHIDARLSRWLRLGVVPLSLTLVGVNSNLFLSGAVHLVWFFLAALLAHGRLAQDRPEASALTEFYTWISVGGVLGGIFAALVAPVAFDQVIEYPIVIVLALLLAADQQARIVRPAPVLLVSLAVGLVAAGWFRNQDEPQLAAVALAAVAALAMVKLPSAKHYAAAIGAMLAVVMLVPLAGVLHQDRSFFGVYQVRSTDTGSHELAMGTTVHGQQRFDDGVGAMTPRTYYHHDGPLGQLMSTITDRDEVAVIGLGAGEIASYGRDGDQYTFYEIDPVVVEIAWDPELFTYLRDTAADIDVVVGDGRLALDPTAEPDLLIVDAFSSDAIPVHLITSEAIDLYLDAVRPGGVVAMHISNRHFRLAPVIGRIADGSGLTALRQDFNPSPEQEATGASGTEWVVLSRDPAALAGLLDVDDRWVPAPTDGPLWTDDYSDILSILRL